MPLEDSSAMMGEPSGIRPSVFLSYAREDLVLVRQFADELKDSGVEVWFDIEFLKPGQLWAEAILAKLAVSDVLVFFVSPASMRSSWVSHELVAFSRSPEKVVIPALIGGSDFADLPGELAKRQAVMIKDRQEVRDAARQVAEAAFRASRRRVQLSPRTEQISVSLADDMARDLRVPGAFDAGSDHSVFLVHGHDHAFRDEVREFLKTLGIDPIILAQVRGPARTLLDRFETLATKAKFAIVLMSSDDIGASRQQFEDQHYGGNATLKFRSRQNVVLELGFFFGRLGWENVFVVQKPADRRWPDFERPSDLGGAVFYETDGESDWREELSSTLRSVGLVPHERGFQQP